MALRDLLINRILQGLITIFVVLIIDFALFNLLPGSYVDLLSRNPNLNPQALQKMIEQFGLNKPLPEQFGIFRKFCWIYNRFFSPNLSFTFTYVP